MATRKQDVNLPLTDADDHHLPAPPAADELGAPASRSSWMDIAFIAAVALPIPILINAFLLVRMPQSRVALAIASLATLCFGLVRWTRVRPTGQRRDRAHLDALSLLALHRRGRRADAARQRNRPAHRPGSFATLRRGAGSHLHSRRFLMRSMHSIVILTVMFLSSLATAQTMPTTRPAETAMVYSNDFCSGLKDWSVEVEKPGRVEANNGVLTIDVPAGCTVWLKRKIEEPVVIEYTATAISNGGPNDRVSDLNCFWMASDPKHPGELPVGRSGKFSDYDTLKTYYVGHGGNTNTTTRFRRYIGEPGNRPLKPEHDLTDAKFLLTPNRPTKIRLVADGGRIEYWRDGERVFELADAEPYTAGYFAFRTVTSHLEIRDFRITRPAAAVSATQPANDAAN